MTSELNSSGSSVFYISLYGLPHTEMFWRTETEVPQVAYIVSYNEWQAVYSLHFDDSSVLRDSSGRLRKLSLFLSSQLKFLNIFQLRREHVGKQVFHSEGSTY
jgi:hypothetical protein